MTGFDDEMAAWSKQWTAQDDTARGLGARMSKAQRMARLGRWVHGLGAIAMTAICAMFAIMSPKVVVWTLMVFVVGVVWVNALYFIWSTRTREAAEPETAFGFMSAHKKLLKVRLRFLEMGTWGGGLIVGFVLAWIPWMIGEHMEAYTREPWRAVVGVGGVVAIFAFSAVLTRRERAKVRRELEALNHLEEEFLLGGQGGAVSG